MQFRVDFGFVDSLLLLCDLEVVLVGLLLGFLFSFLVFESDLLNLKVQVLLLSPQTLELVLVLQFFSDIACEGIELQLRELILESIIPVAKLLLVLLNLLLVSLDIWVVLQLLAESVG